MKKTILLISIVFIYSCSKNSDDTTEELNLNDLLTVDFTNSIDSNNYITFEYFSQVDLTIDWGDGTIETLVAGNFFGRGVPKKHDYGSKQVYHVKIKGEENIIDLRVKTNLNNARGYVSRINVSNMTKLYTLVASNNQISQIDLSQNSELRALELGQNKLTSIDLNNNSKLKWTLHLSENDLSSLNIDNLIDLEMLHIIDNNLSALDLSNNLKLDLVSVYNNPNLSCIKIANNQDTNGFSIDQHQELKTSCD